MNEGSSLRAYQQFAKTRHWHHHKRYSLNATETYWLRGNQSLTKQLIEHSKQFEVIVLNEAIAKPLVHEAKQLGLAFNKIAKIREVELRCDGQTMVYARSVIPLEALKGSGLQLAKLGNKPLGHLLFKRAKVDLETRQLSKVTVQGKQRWARRTIYRFNTQDILVSEFFMDRF